MKEEKTKEMNTTKITPKQFGKDHWSLLAYIETRCVDYKGVLDVAHLRISDPAIGMGSYHTLYNRPKWKPEYGTRLAGYFKEDGTKDETRQIKNHDDLDCIDELEEAGYIENIGTELTAYKMTKLGNQVAALLRQHKTDGKHYATFTI